MSGFYSAIIKRAPVVEYRPDEEEEIASQALTHNDGQMKYMIGTSINLDILLQRVLRVMADSDKVAEAKRQEQLKYPARSLEHHSRHCEQRIESVQGARSRLAVLIRQRFEEFERLCVEEAALLELHDEYQERLDRSAAAQRELEEAKQAAQEAMMKVAEKQLALKDTRIGVARRDRERRSAAAAAPGEDPRSASIPAPPPTPPKPKLKQLAAPPRAPRPNPAAAAHAQAATSSSSSSSVAPMDEAEDLL